jgi:hypothetical protein
MRIIFVLLALNLAPALGCDKHPNQTHEEWAQMNFAAGQKRIDTTPQNSFFEKRNPPATTETQNIPQRRPIRKVR